MITNTNPITFVPFSSVSAPRQLSESEARFVLQREGVINHLIEIENMVGEAIPVDIINGSIRQIPLDQLDYRRLLEAHLSLSDLKREIETNFPGKKLSKERCFLLHCSALIEGVIVMLGKRSLSATQSSLERSSIEVCQIKESPVQLNGEATMLDLVYVDAYHGEEEERDALLMMTYFGLHVECLFANIPSHLFPLDQSPNEVGFGVRTSLRLYSSARDNSPPLVGNGYLPANIVKNDEGWVIGDEWKNVAREKIAKILAPDEQPPTSAG